MSCSNISTEKQQTWVPFLRDYIIKDPTTLQEGPLLPLGKAEIDSSPKWSQETYKKNVDRMPESKCGPEWAFGVGS